MTDERINDLLLDEMAQDFAKEIMAEIEDGDEPTDRAREYADGSQWVIYYHKAHELCANCNTDNGEQFLEDVGTPDDVTYNKLATSIAYGELYHRICVAISDIQTAQREAE